MTVLNPVPGEDRRGNDPILLQLVQQIHDSQVELDRKLTQHMLDETAEFDRVLSQAFPGGDMHGHRQAHMAWIEEVEERTDFYRKMKTKLAEWGLLGFMAWAVYALWQAFLMGPKK